MDMSTAGASFLSAVASVFSFFVSPGDPALMQTYSVNRQWNALERINAVNPEGKALWATPSETLRAGGGNSVSLAVGKYFELVAKGYNEDTMRLALLEDPQTKSTKYIVIYRQDGSSHYLDSTTNSVKELGDFSPYQVVYKMNRNAFEIGSMTLLSRHTEDLGSWRALLQRMKEEGSLKGQIFTAKKPKSTSDDPQNIAKF